MITFKLRILWDEIPSPHSASLSRPMMITSFSNWNVSSAIALERDVIEVDERQEECFSCSFELPPGVFFFEYKYVLVTNNNTDSLLWEQFDSVKNERYGSRASEPVNRRFHLSEERQRVPEEAMCINDGFFGQLRSLITFVGCGSSGGVPAARCIMQAMNLPSDSSDACRVCPGALKGNRNWRGNPSLLLSQSGRSLLIDCGKSFRMKIMQLMSVKPLRRAFEGVILTHAHADAMLGLDDLRDWMSRKGPPMKIFVRADDLKALEGPFDYLINQSKATGSGHVASLEFHVIEPWKPFSCAGMTITPVPLNHGPRCTALGFVIGELAYFSDFRALDQRSVDALRSVRTLICDSTFLARDCVSHISLRDGMHILRTLNHGIALPQLERVFFTGMTHEYDYYSLNDNLLQGWQAGVSLRTERLRSLCLPPSLVSLLESAPFRSLFGDLRTALTPTMLNLLRHQAGPSPIAASSSSTNNSSSSDPHSTSLSSMTIVARSPLLRRLAALLVVLSHVWQSSRSQVHFICSSPQAETSTWTLANEDIFLPLAAELAKPLPNLQRSLLLLLEALPAPKKSSLLSQCHFHDSLDAISLETIQKKHALGALSDSSDTLLVFEQLVLDDTDQRQEKLSNLLPLFNRICWLADEENDSNDLSPLTLFNLDADSEVDNGEEEEINEPNDANAEKKEGIIIERTPITSHPYILLQPPKPYSKRKIRLPAMVDIELPFDTMSLSTSLL